MRNLSLFALLAATTVGCAPTSPMHFTDPGQQGVKSWEDTVNERMSTLGIDGTISGEISIDYDSETKVFSVKEGVATNFYHLEKARLDNDAKILVSNNHLTLSPAQLSENANVLYIQETENGFEGEVRVISSHVLTKIKNTPVGNEFDSEYNGYKLRAAFLSTANSETLNIVIPQFIDISSKLGTDLTTQLEIDQMRLDQ